MLPVVELEPDGQDTQVPGPAEFLNLPSSHALHGSVPVDILYLPAVQAVQFCPSEEYPGTHTQAVDKMLPGGELE